MQTTVRPTASAAFPQVWDNSQFFSGTSDPAIATTIEALKSDIASIGTACLPFMAAIATADALDPAEFTALIDQVSTVYQQRKDIQKRLGNVSTYIYTALSADTQDANANAWMPILQKLSADLSEALTPYSVFLLRASEDFITALLSNAALSETAFSIYHSRKLKDQLLSVAEEQLITGLATNGLHAWGNLYSDLAGTLKCDIQGESMGLAQAANLLSHPPPRNSPRCLGRDSQRLEQSSACRRRWAQCD